MIHLFVADDHAVVREGLARIVELVEDMCILGEAADARSTIQLCRQNPPDVLILDLSLPEGGGAEAIRQLKTTLPDLAIVVYSMYSEEQYGAPTLRAGASAYLSKHRSTGELLDAVRRVASGGRYVTDTVADRLLSTPGGGPDPQDQLTERERQVLQLLSEGLTTSDIANQLFVTQSTVSTHLKNIREKLGVGTRAEIIRYAYRKGLMS